MCAKNIFVEFIEELIGTLIMELWLPQTGPDILIFPEPRRK